MIENEMDREIESIKQTIIDLGKRGHICKSELKNILCGCRANSISLSELEILMLSIIDDSVSYIDDTDSSSPFHYCVFIQEELNKNGYEDLFQFLSISKNLSNEEIVEAYKRMKSDEIENDLYEKIGLLIETGACLEIYRHFFLECDVPKEKLEKEVDEFLIPVKTDNERNKDYRGLKNGRY